MFDSLSKDFGNVPYGSVNTHRFTLTNNTQQTIQLSDVRSSCRCATPKAEKFSAGPGEKLNIDVAYNTTTFTGARGMTITCTFTSPVTETVSLRVQGYSRPDVVLDPGQLDFGVIPPAKEQTRAVRLEYAGALDWRIGEVVAGRYVTAKAVEKARGAGQVKYELEITLSKEAPRGLLMDALQIKTNDPSSPLVRLDVAANIEGGLYASPEKVAFGPVPVGGAAKQRLIVKNDKPFSVASFKVEATGLSLKATPGEKTAHLVEVEYSPKKAGKVEDVLQIRTGSGELLPIKFTAEGK
jgi:hypothetical protein